MNPPAPDDGFEVLAELALDLRSSWNHRADVLWETIDPELWRSSANPWVIVQNASRARLRALWDDPSFRARALALREHRRELFAAEAWFQRAHKADALTSIAFFSMEYALSEALPLYSGGLGNVAGDYLKAASDLGVPLVGVGLLYQQGYFRQTLDARGEQHEFFPFNDTSQLPIVPVRDAAGECVRVRVPRATQSFWLRAWSARVGRVTLVLLDSNDPSNTPVDRGVTAQLYGGGPEARLLQEMALGIGGFRALRAMGIAPEVCHLNEGHAAFAVLERARDFMRANDVPFDVALAATRAGNVFTTHTPVGSAFDRFDAELVSTYLGAYAKGELGVSIEHILALGRAHADDGGESLSMAWLATRGSGAINGVSRRHGEVSRRIFQVLFPRWPEPEVPVGHVTNGVHVPSWDSAAADALWTEACGGDRWVGTIEDVARKIADRPDAELWAMRARERRDLVDFVRERLARELAASGASDEALATASRVLDPDALTIGFARRSTGYKRPALLLEHPERLARLLCDAARPVQIVLAGKAHPRDEEGKALLARWVRFVRRADVRRRAVFLADYDLRVAERLVQGVDLWINTPRPPWEACGTSGMKVLVNGGINLSSLDGWWAEAFRPEVGWSIPTGERSDAEDAALFYDRLEREIVPSFYERDPDGIPPRWVARMRASMATLTQAYSADRALRAYTTEYYEPAAAAFARRRADRGAAAARLVERARAMTAGWPGVRFGETRVRTEGGVHRFEVGVYVGEVDPDDVVVELYAERDGDRTSRVALRRGAPLVGANGHVWVGEVPATRPAADFTARARAADGDAKVPLELPLVAWSR